MLRLPALKDAARTSTLGRIHADWTVAAEAVHGTMASLSQQLRRFLDDRALVENRRIMEILYSVERHALNLRSSHPVTFELSIDTMRTVIELPMDRRMFRPPTHLPLIQVEPQPGEADTDASSLYSLSIVDRAELYTYIKATLEEQHEVTLRELTQLRPLRHGLAELLTYLDLGSSRFDLTALDFMHDTIAWQSEDDEHEIERTVTMQRILFKEKTA